MVNTILQNFVPMLTALAMFVNSFGAVFGIDAIIPYNPERTEITLEGDITTDVDEILGYFNSAVKNSGLVIGTSTLEIVGTPDVTVNGEKDEDTASYWQSIEEAPVYIFEIPVNGELTAADVESAEMSVKDGRKSIIINLKDTDEITPDSPVAKGFGFDIGVKEGLEALDFEILDDDYEEIYTDCVISCVIGNNGKIIYGDWDSQGYINIENISANLFGIDMTMSMEYTCKSHIDI